MILSIAIASPVRDTFDYLSGEFAETTLQVGCRVRVNFAGRQLVGVIVKVKQTTDVELKKLKPIETILDDSPVLPQSLLTLLLRIARYYHHPLGEVIFAALPIKLRQGKPLDSNDQEVWYSSTSEPTETIAKLKSSPKQRALLGKLQATQQGMTAATLRDEFKNPQALLTALQSKQLVTAHREAVMPPGTNAKLPRVDAPVLNDEQKNAVQVLTNTLGRFGTSLLDGVTGSGKTEVYLALIEMILQQQGQILIVVPEINLTPQLEQRFRQRLGDIVATLHSGLNDGERLAAWRAASVGNLSVIIGTRSATFTAFKSLQLIIVDEEHDTSLKQQKGFRYHARDIALLRAQIEDCPVVLGSATPSLESLENVTQGKYQSVLLTQRAGDAKPPRLHLVDLRRQQLTEGLSHALLEKMGEHLQRGNQVLLFLNRRGYTPVLLCHDCGEALDCPRCSSHTVWHAGIHELRCHHCGYQSRPPATCPACGKPELLAVGLGTQKLEQVVQSCFPNEPVIRVDRDSMSTKTSLPEALKAIANNQYRIIIGTQLLAKGHDFPNITLVGMIDVDQGLFSTDFHAPERLIQQVLQVSGRAGRGKIPGEVVIQTHQPEHPLLQQLLHEPYSALAKAQLEDRQEAGWPPYSHIALIHASAIEPAQTTEFLRDVKSLCLPVMTQQMEVLGPVSSPMARIAGRFRFQLLLRAESRRPLHQVLKAIRPQIQKLKSARKLRWSIDIDPVDMN